MHLVGCLVVGTVLRSVVGSVVRLVVCSVVRLDVGSVARLGVGAVVRLVVLSVVRLVVRLTVNCCECLFTYISIAIFAIDSRGLYILKMHLCGLLSCAWFQHFRFMVRSSLQYTHMHIDTYTHIPYAFKILKHNKSYLK